MFSFDPTSYGSGFASLLEPMPLNELGPGSPDETVRSALGEMDLSSAFDDQTVTDRNMARCCLSAVWLLHDFLDTSHTISQDVDTTTGSYWHGIMHRREPDFSNAKYWFRRVGHHPLFDPLSSSARQLAEAERPAPPAEFFTSSAGWDPMQFIDLCQNSIGEGSPTELLCRRVAQLEWQMLFDFCYRRATAPLDR